MEVAQVNTASAQASAPAPSSAEHTPQAQASPSPQVSVSHTGAPGTTAPKLTDNITAKWTDAFDADTKDYITQKGFQDPKAVLESYRNLEKLRGVPQERLLKLPEASDAPEWNDVYTKLGKPATPEGYGLKPQDPNNTGFTDWAKDAFHKLNLTTAQGQELVKAYDAFNETQAVESKAQYSARVQEQTTALKKEWGAAFNQNVSRAQAAYRQLGVPDAAIDSLEKSIGFDGVMKLFGELGAKVGEHTYVEGSGDRSFGEGAILSPAQANARIKALKQDGEWSARYLKGEVKARAEMERLMKMSNPAD